MALSKGDLSDVKEQLSQQLSDKLDEDQRNRLSQAFPSAAQDGYESAGEAKDEAAKLAQAAESGDVGGKYEQFYENNPDIREAISEAAAQAFSQSDEEAIADAADQQGVSEAYTHCSHGDFGEAAEAINMEPGAINAQSANECRQQVQEKSGFAESLFRAYQDEDSTETYVGPQN